jgi:hypothetical protein
MPVYPMARPPILDVVEAKPIKLHLGHHAQDQIVALLRTGKPRASRCIQESHRCDAVPKVLKIGRPSKRSSELVAITEVRALQDLWVLAPELATEVTSEKLNGKEIVT